MKKTLALILALTMVISMCAACGTNGKTSSNDQATSNSQQEETPDSSTEPVTFHYMIGVEPPGFDPSLNQGDVIQCIYQNLFEGLVTCDKDGNIIPAGCTEWTVSDDGLVYTFKLREDAKWTDGKPVTAHDYVYALKRALDPATAAMYSWYIKMFIKNSTEYADGTCTEEELGIKALDDFTLEYTLNAPATYFPQALLQGVWLPLRQDAVEADPEQWVYHADTCISNGPFVLEEYKIGSHISFKKNENYWGADEVSIDEVRYTFMTGDTTALAAFRAGDVDGFSNVPTADLVDIITTDNRLHTFDRLSFNFLRLNTSTPGLDNPKVRRAINLGIDRQAYLDGMGVGLTTSVALGPVPKGLMLAGKDFREVSGDNGLSATGNIEEAQKLLAEAGYPNGEGLPVYRIVCANDGRANAEIMQQMLETNLGIKTEIYSVDNKLVMSTMKDGDYDLGYSGWAGDYTHPSTFLNLFLSTSSNNHTCWGNSEYDELIQKATISTSEEEQLELLVQAEHILMEESPIVPLMVPTTTMMMQEFVTDWHLSSQNVLYIRDAKVDRPAA